MTSQPLRVGIGGPVGSGKTALTLALCRELRERNLAVVTNDIYTQEDAEFLVRNEALAPERIIGVETGGCPHTAIREDASINLEAVDQLNRRFPGLELILVESGGDNLSATFSPELSDLTLYVIDVSAGDKIPRKGGPGICKSDLLVINKIDLAPLVGASLDVMDRDAPHARRQAVRVQQPEDRPGAGRNHRLHRAPGPADRRLTPLRNDKEPPMKLPAALAALAPARRAGAGLRHPGHGEHGLVAGLAHPLTGLDHLLAIRRRPLGRPATGSRAPRPALHLRRHHAGRRAARLRGARNCRSWRPASPPRCSPSASAWPSPCPPLALAMAATALFALAHGVAHGLELPDPPAPGVRALRRRHRRAARRRLRAGALPAAGGRAPGTSAGLASAGAGVWLLAG